MPQPIRRWTDMQFAEASIIARPELGIFIARIAAVWSEIEVNMGLLLGDMLNTEARTGVSMYLALSGSAAQDKILLAAADACLPHGLKNEFAELVAEMRRRGKERNAVVHALWGAPESDPDKLVNCPPDNIVGHVAKEVYSLESRADVFMKPPSQEFISHLRSYTDKNFEEILVRLREFRQKLLIFSHAVLAVRKLPAALAPAQELQAGEGSEGRNQTTQSKPK